MLAVIWNSPDMLFGKDPEIDYIPETGDDCKKLAEFRSAMQEKMRLQSARLEREILEEADCLCAGDARPESLKRLETALYKMENLADGVGKKRKELEAKGFKVPTYLRLYLRGGNHKQRTGEMARMN